MSNLRLHFIVRLICLAVLLAATAGCRPADEPMSMGETMPTLTPVALSADERLNVVATTSIVGDVVRAVGGDRVALTVLLPPGSDPHAYEPTPQDAAAVADADVVFINGAGLELFLERLLRSAGSQTPVVPLSYGIPLRQVAEEEGHEHEEHEGEHEHGEYDPHTWFDPNNVIVWTENVESALSALDPAGADLYAANGAAYRARLQELDAWIRNQVAQVPPEQRLLVTDHAMFGYFADRYGFEQVGAVLPGFSTLAQPSAQELAALEESIRALGVRAVFVGTGVNPNLAERVAEDTGTQLVVLYTHSLSEPGGPADSYLALMRTDVTAIVEALR